MVFAIPRAQKTYIGTTDTFYSQDAAHPKTTEQDVDYILRAISFMFPSVKVTKHDVESSWAGVRPLIYEEGKDPSEISRKDEVWESESGLITIAGGKLTGYRKMAEMVVDLLVRDADFKGNAAVLKKSKTKKLPISGGHVGGSKNLAAFISSHQNEALQLGFTVAQYTRLAQIYGSNIGELLNIAKLFKRDHPYRLPLDVYVQIEYSLHHEMACKPVDFFIRRTGALFFNIEWVQRWKTPVLSYMGKELKWSFKQEKEYAAELEAELHDASHPHLTYHS
jgi:glycerol-3-phosphate dehydrogenase